MTGGDKSYSHQAGFYTVYGTGDHINAVGEIDTSRFDTITHVFKPDRTNKNVEEVCLLNYDQKF